MRDRHGSRDHEGARAHGGERERIARRAKVPSKHGTGMTRNSAAAGAAGAFQGNVMRCEAINAPSTRLDLRLHRHGALFRRRPLLASPHARLLLPARPIPLRTARRLFSSLRIISIYFPTPPSRALLLRSTVPPSLPPAIAGSPSACSNPTATGDGFTRPFSRSFFAQSAP